MQPTKYSPEPLQATPVAFLATDEHPYPITCQQAPPDRARVSGAYAGGEADAEGVASLDLIEEHLSTEISQTEYRRGSHGGKLLENWWFPDTWQGVSEADPFRFVMKIQPFAKGGYEATCRRMNLDVVGRAIVGERRFGSRIENLANEKLTDEEREEKEAKRICNLEKGAQRAKRKMRLQVKNMQADHLVTFTRREADGSTYWTADQWAEAWKKFHRLLARAEGDFPYVAILEKHEKGNYHLHVAWVGRVHVGIVRKMWIAALGGVPGSGNIDAKHIRVAPGHDRAARIARYISKYVSKHFQDQPRFNKKRYWATKQTLEEAQRYVMTAGTVTDALHEMAGRLGLDLALIVRLHVHRQVQDSLFFFPDDSGLWFAYNPDVHGVDPPF